MTKHRLSDSTPAPVPTADPMTEPVVAVLVARQTPERDTAEVQSSLSELRRLVEGLGIPVVSSYVQKRGPGPSLEILGKGKLAEVAGEVARIQEGPPAQTPLVVVDQALTPGQLRLLNQQLEVEVIDRTDVILRVFARRARTRVAQLEVELAGLTYEAPRVRDVNSLNERTGGGGGRGERGHTNVELRKQQIRSRVARIEAELEKLRPQEQRQRDRRGELPAVALVGYTNAGKSSLMRGLTGSDVLVEDKLFATLGTTVRAISPVTMPRILLADTVGFIKNLPHELISSFRATLDEAREADLLLVVVDASDPRWREQLEVTRSTLGDLGPGLPPSVLVFNKIDLLSPDQIAEVARNFPEAVTMNAHDPEDLRALRQKLVEFFEAGMVIDQLSVPVTDGRLQADIRAHARILDERLDDDGVTLHVRLRALPRLLERWRASTSSN